VVYTSRMRNSLAFVVAGLVACGGSTKGPEDPTGAGSAAGGAKPSGPGDVSFEVQAQEIKGLTFEPEAMGLMSPGMPLVNAKKKTTLDKQRQTFDKTKDPVQKQAHAAILATMLYEQSKAAKGAEDKAKLWQDARQVLNDAAKVAGDKVDEITLRMLGSYELLLEDFPAAEKAWGALVAQAPKDKDLVTNKAWWAYTLLKQYKNAEALAALSAETPSEKVPELAYALAWAKFRTGDKAGAWTALLTAAKGWGNMPGKDALDRDVFMFAGRTDVSFEAALAALQPIYGKSKDQQYELFAKLGLQSYQFAGRWSDGVTALDKAIDLYADKVPVNDRPVIRYTQADYTVRLDDPVRAAKYAVQAVDAIPACGTKCSDKDKTNLITSVYIMGRLFHILYATAHDDRFYQPAHDLYAAAVPKLTSDDKMRAEAQKDADFLEKTFKSMKAGVGTHDKGAVGALLGRHNQEVQACYEATLATNPKLVGTLALNLESDQDGAIKGVSTEPKAGMADMSLVATCVGERAKSWRLPKRAQAGSTRIKISYSMSLLKK
jgi:tetratricopeptide (TPR) repeat protein